MRLAAIVVFVMAIAADMTGCSLLRKYDVVKTVVYERKPAGPPVARISTRIEGALFLFCVEDTRPAEIVRIERTTRGWRRGDFRGPSRETWGVIAVPFLLLRSGGDPLGAVVLAAGIGAFVAVALPVSFPFAILGMGYDRAMDELYPIAMDFVLFPVDAVVSLGVALHALASDDYEIAYGPLGVLLSILPGFTCVAGRFGDFERAETEDRVLGRETTVEPVPIRGAEVRVEGPGGPFTAKTDASGTASVPLARIAVAALPTGDPDRRFAVRSAGGSTVTAIPLGALVRAADGEDADRLLPRAGADGVDPRLRFWSLVEERARGRDRELAETAADRVALLGRPAPAPDAATARLLAGGRGEAAFEGGTLVDWAPGAAAAKAPSHAEIALTAAAGPRVALTVRFTNDGERALYQVRAMTRSTVPCLNGVDVLIGKVPPKATVTRRVDLPVAAVRGDVDLAVAVDFRVPGAASPSALEGRARVRGSGAREP